MAPRPYFNKSIRELEQLYEANQGNCDITKDLFQELGYRKTPRALRLKGVIETRQTKLPVDGVTQRHAEQLQPSIPETPPSQPALSSVGTSGPTRSISPDQPANAPSRAQAQTRATQPIAKPPISNEPEDILRTWTALEVLSPHGYRRKTDLAGGDQRRIAPLDNDLLPWEVGEKSIPKRRLYYELILGTINLGPAIEALLKVYSDNRPDAPRTDSRAALASILLDKYGRPLEEDTSFAVSSFAWGVPIALKGDLTLLGNWPTAERALKRSFHKSLVTCDEDGEVFPLTKSSIRTLYEQLVAELNLSHLDEFFASRVPPEPSLLNSFFLEDLALAREQVDASNAPRALQYYLGIEQPKQRTNLLEDNDGLRTLLQPSNTPLGRWPGPGRFPLALLQQAAVNATAGDAVDSSIIAVNGPPGTGKTTLLRDIVAARIVERAEVMVGFNSPADAFTRSDEVFQRGGAKVTLHRLNERLKGFEMVVASSNNKAVENVSAELPSLDAIASDALRLRYLPSISSNLLGRETWGAIAAVLGNLSNRNKFAQAFWRDEEHGLSTYLNHAAGVPQIVIEPNSSGRPHTRLRNVVEKERPPENRQEALSQWRGACAEFSTAVDQARATQVELQKLHDALERTVDLRNELTEVKRQFDELERTSFESRGKAKEAERAVAHCVDTVRSHHNKVAEHRRQRPAFFARLFRLRPAREWHATQRVLLFDLCAAKTEESNAKVDASRIQSTIREAEARLAEAMAQRECITHELAPLEQAIAAVKAAKTWTIPDAAFFDSGHETIQTSHLWFGQAENAERDHVFEAAIAVHRAFIGAAADPIRQNLAIFTEAFGTRSLGTSEKDKMIPDLWSTFFLVIPVVSTTFASVRRMFSRLGPESLGWLLVDEAGQAAPQAAVGAIMRTKRAVVVGDPLQIEPVVMLPNALTEEICGYFGVRAFRYNAPEASVQTLADTASPYCARFPLGSGHRDVGAPLLVHRRCDSPMFEISNMIAYANLMVQAKKPTGAPPPCGPSRWVDVQGKPGPDKWCEDEASVLLEHLQLMRSNGAAPDLYVVTPFVIVQDTLRRRLVESGVLNGWVDEPRSWVHERVGTVHTVQGREAETVFFVLGAQSPSQNGARAWAGGRPNLANVAVTRARSALYVIGNSELWRTAGVFKTLSQFVR